MSGNVIDLFPIKDKGFKERLKEVIGDDRSFDVAYLYVMNVYADLEEEQNGGESPSILGDGEVILAAGLKTTLAFAARNQELKDTIQQLEEAHIKQEAKLRREEIMINALALSIGLLCVVEAVRFLFL